MSEPGPQAPAGDDHAVWSEGPAGAAGPGPGAREGVHLQAALLELIGAARVALDAVEAVVSDPEVLAPVVETVAEVGRGLFGMLRSSLADAARRPGGAGPAQSEADGGAGAPGDGEGPDPSRRPARRPGSVERIRVS